MASNLRLRFRVPPRNIYICRITKNDENGIVIDDWRLTSNPRAASGTQHEMAPRTRRGIPSDPQQHKRSIRLTVKAPPSRLQEIKGDDDEEDSRPSRVRAGRVKNPKQSYVEKGSSAEEDEDEDEDAEGDVDDQDEEEEDSEEDEEDSEEDADGDVDMEDVPAPKPSKPTIKFSAPSSSKSNKGRKASPGTTINLGGNKHRTVEDKEMGEAASESESSEVEDDPEDVENGALDEADEMEDRGDTIKVDAVNESDLDSEDSNDSSFPDLSKLTRRQRGGVDEGSLMALSNEAQKKKFFTAEQITMRRAEMARRRKDLSEKRNEQEKADTLRRLLQKPTPTRRSRAQVLADAEREEFGPGRAGLRGESVGGEEEEEPEIHINRIYTRTMMGGEGTKVGVPSDWLEAPAGGMFERVGKGEGWANAVKKSRMVEEVH